MQLKKTINNKSLIVNFITPINLNLLRIHYFFEKYKKINKRKRINKVLTLINTPPMRG